jgi:hypothetical protein
MTKRHRGGRGIALPILDLGAGRGWVLTLCPGCLTPRKEIQCPLQGAGWALGSALIGLANLALSRTRSPDRRAHGESLYRRRSRLLFVYEYKGKSVLHRGCYISFSSISEKVVEIRSYGIFCSIWTAFVIAYYSVCRDVSQRRILFRWVATPNGTVPGKQPSVTANLM